MICAADLIIFKTMHLALNLYLSVVLEVFWNEMSYCFSESVGNATTMLRTNSCFNDSIGLTAFPKPVEDIVSNVTFETTLFNQRLTRTIDFVCFNDTEYAVGAIGEWNEVCYTCYWYE